MKILKIIFDFYPNFGGAEISALEISKQLIKSGHQVYVVTSKKGKQKSYEKLFGIHIIRIPILPTIYLSQISFIIGGICKIIYLKKIIQFDLVHCYLIVPSGIIGVISKYVTKLPFLLTIQGGDISKYSNILLLNKLIKYALINSDVITVLSTFLKSETKKHGIPDGKIKLIPNGIDKKMLSKADGHVIKRAYNLNEAIHFITACSLRKVKGLDNLINAFHLATQKSKKPIKLMIIGDGPEETNLKKLVQHLKIEDKVIFSGKVIYNKVAEYMKAANIFVLSSLYEGMGNVILEAMSCGLPIITTDCGGPLDYVKNNYNGLVVPVNDIEKMKDAMIKLIENEDLRGTFSERNLKLTDKIVFDWSIIEEQYMSMYSKIIQKK